MTITAVIPFFNGHSTIHRLLDSLPADMPVVIVDDQSDEALDAQLSEQYPNVHIEYLPKKGYFAGAVNAGLRVAQGDVLILNQDVWFEGDGWQQIISANRQRFGVIGDGVFDHPAWPMGYVQGTFMFLRRDLIDQTGLFDGDMYPLWGCTAEYQLRACRLGFEALPLRAEKVPGMRHEREVGKAFGSSLQSMVDRRPDLQGWFTRTPPEVSVVIPCYNYGRFLSDAIASLIGGDTSLGRWEAPGQTFQAFDVIIVDDASDDETSEIGQTLANPWKGINYYRMPDSNHPDGGPNNGTPVANNYGIERAKGRVIAMMSADDMMERDRLGRLYSEFKRRTRDGELVAVYDDPQLFSHGQRTKVMELGVFNPARMLVKNHVHAGIMFAKKAWKKAGGYPVEMRYGREDWAFNVAMCAEGVCFVKVPMYAGYLYRREGHNRTERNTTPVWASRFQAQLRGLFPALYNGEKRMSCCNGDGNSIGVEGMVYVKYTGQNHGKGSWWGSVSNARYIFRGPGDVQAVDSRDAPDLLAQYEGTRQLFTLVNLSQEAAPDVDPDVAAEANPIIPAAVPEIEPFVAPDVEPLGGTVWPESNDDPAINISGMSVAEIGAYLQEHDPDAVTVQALIDGEKVGRNRKGVLQKLEGYLQ